MSNRTCPSRVLVVLALAALAFPSSAQQTFPLEVMERNGAEVIVDEALVRFRGEVSAVQRLAVHRALGCELIEPVAKGLDRVRLGGKSLDDALGAYDAHAMVEYAEPHHVYRLFGVPNDPKWSQQWAPQNMNCPAAWDMHLGGSAVVAVLDSSVDTGHADLAAHYEFGWDYFNGDSDPYDFLDFIGHGTHCSGIAAAVTNNGQGIAGIGHDGKFAFYQVGMLILVSDAAVIQAVNDTVARGWHVISMSFGGTASSTSMENALDLAYQAGVVLVAAAGNDGTTALNYPAAYANVIGVASHNVSNQRSSFSNYGTWVSVSAPGEGIHSTVYEAWGGYADMDGTSMACPAVAGMASLLYSFVGGTRTQANADLIRDAIESSSIPVAYVEHGRVDVEAALVHLSGASAMPYNGTGVNPSILTSLGLPRIDTSWTAQVDGTGHGTPILSLLAGYSAPFGGVVLGIGELLIDLGSAKVFWKTTPVSAGVATHSIPIPNDLGLLGYTAYAQAYLISSGGSGLLTNGLEVVVGR